MESTNRLCSTEGSTFTSERHAFKWTCAVQTSLVQWSRIVLFFWLSFCIYFDWESLGRQGDQTLNVHGKDYAEAIALIFLPPVVKSWLIRKDLDAGKDWRQEEKGTTEDELTGWHHRLNGHQFEQTPRDSEGQGCLEWCSPQGHKESDMTEWLSNKLRVQLTKLIITVT